MENNNRNDEIVSATLQIGKKRFFEVSGNFWVDALIITLFPWFVVAAEAKNRLELNIGKVVLIGLGSFLILTTFYVGIFSKDEFKDKYYSTQSKYEALESKFKKYEAQVDGYKDKVNKLKAEKKDVKETKDVVVKETEKVTLKPTQKPTKKPVVKKTYNFSPGRYAVGSDIKAGVYDIICVSGSGNVYTTDNGWTETVNLIMSPVANDFYVTSYKNAKLNKGAILSVENVSIKLVEK